MPQWKGCRPSEATTLKLRCKGRRGAGRLSRRSRRAGGRRRAGDGTGEGVGGVSRGELAGFLMADKLLLPSCGGGKTGPPRLSG